MTHRAGCILVVFLIAGITAQAGCSSGKPGPNDSDRMTRAVLRVLSEFYGDYLDFHKGKPPKDVDAFHAYLEARSEDLKLYNVESPDQLYSSPRDGQPLVIVCGKRLAPADSPTTPWAAYEQTGVDGTRMAARVRGGVHELSADEVAQIFQSN